VFGEENSPQEGRHEGERISDESNNDVLEGSGALYKRTPVFIWREISLRDELVRDEEYLCSCEHEYPREFTDARTHSTMVEPG